MCQNWDIGQDSKGVIYVANRNGLVCYDGKTWQTYTTNENRTIRSLYISPDDRIYIGSYEEFGYFERNEYGKLVYTSISSLFQHKELKNKDIWSIEQDENLIPVFCRLFLFRYPIEEDCFLSDEKHDATPL